MKKIVATPAGAPRMPFIKYVGWTMSLYLVAIGVEQFVQAAKHASSIMNYCTEGEVSILAFIALLAIPFLAGMKLSKLMRLVSLCFGWMLSGLFFMMAVLDTTQGGIMGNLALYSFVALMLIVTWGYWPYRKTEKPKVVPKNLRKTQKN
jgi:hypothetical protein